MQDHQTIPNWEFYSDEYKNAVKNTIAQCSKDGRSFTESLRLAAVMDFSLMSTDTQREIIAVWMYPDEILNGEMPYGC